MEKEQKKGCMEKEKDMKTTKEQNTLTFFNDPLTFFNDPLTSKPPSEDEIQEEVDRIWQEEKQEGDEQANLIAARRRLLGPKVRLEARRRLLGQNVWNNNFLRGCIVGRLDNKTRILGVAKLGEAENKLVSNIIVYLSKLSWKQFGEVQVIINDTLGEVHLTPKQNFHVTDIFDFD